MERYFTCISRHSPVDSYYSLVTENEAERNIFAVNNGWTWSNSRDPLNEHPTSRCYILRDDFASYQMATSYLLRDVVAWTDCVKVRYYEGDQPTWIMPIMEEYVQISAYIFDGFRLDNCHNASISLLEHFTSDISTKCVGDFPPPSLSLMWLNILQFNSVMTLTTRR